jgi:transposase
MLYLGIDQHKNQLTVNVRNEEGEAIFKRQVSTQWEKVRQFFADFSEKAKPEGGFMAILEVCGMNPWLIEMLKQYGCGEIVIIQPTERSKKKTDRGDAGSLSETLWVNRQRFLDGKHPPKVRRIRPPTAQEAENRQITTFRFVLTKRRTATLNAIHRILRKHNLEQERPTKKFQTQKMRRWLAELALGELDRLEMDSLLKQWTLWDQQLAAVEVKIAVRAAADEQSEILQSMPGIGEYSALAIACRIGDIKDFPRPSSLANYFGLTPGCRNSGEATQRLGSITKQGSKIVRYLLGQAVVKVLRFDPDMRAWYKRIKHRRGAKIGRVAAMRRMVTIIWHMLTKKERYQYATPIRKHQEFEAFSGTNPPASASPREQPTEGSVSRGPSPEPPKDLAHQAQRGKEQKPQRTRANRVVRPHSSSSPDAALGSLPSVALSSASG